jgi:hypothetical protein
MHATAVHWEECDYVQAEQLTLPSRLKRGGKDVEVEQEMEASGGPVACATA